MSPAWIYGASRYVPGMAYLTDPVRVDVILTGAQAHYLDTIAKANDISRSEALRSTVREAMRQAERSARLSTIPTSTGLQIEAADGGGGR